MGSPSHTHIHTEKKLQVRPFLNATCITSRWIKKFVRMTFLNDVKKIEDVFHMIGMFLLLSR